MAIDKRPLADTPTEETTDTSTSTKPIRDGGGKDALASDATSATQLTEGSGDTR